MSNIVVRTISGAIFVIVVIGSILLGAYACAAVMAVFVVWAMLEYYTIVFKNNMKGNKIIGVFTGVLLFAASFFYSQDLVSGRVFLIFIPLMASIFISQLYSTDNNSFSSLRCSCFINTWEV